MRTQSIAAHPIIITLRIKPYCIVIRSRGQNLEKHKSNQFFTAVFPFINAKIPIIQDEFQKGFNTILAVKVSFQDTSAQLKHVRVK
jgi:hypothetical protein